MPAAGANKLLNKVNNIFKCYRNQSGNEAYKNAQKKDELMLRHVLNAPQQELS